MKGSSILGFVGDLFDRSAERNCNPAWTAEITRTLGLGIVNLASFWDAAAKVSAQVFGDFTSLLQLILAIIGCAWCISIIRGKTQRQASSLELAAAAQHEYSSSTIVRFSAKLAFMAFLLIIPTKTISAVGDLLPLPSTIYGYLIDLDSGQPLEQARVSLVTADGVDITAGVWFSDSHGFYIVTSSRRAWRSAKLIVTHPCAKPVMLSLSKSYQINPTDAEKQQDIEPLFRHVITCAGENHE